MALCISFIAENIGSMIGRVPKRSLTSALHFCLLNSKKYRNMRFECLSNGARSASGTDQRARQFEDSAARGNSYLLAALLHDKPEICLINVAGVLCYPGLHGRVCGHGCPKPSNFGVLSVMASTLAWPGRLLYVTRPENSRGRSFNADNHEQQAKKLSAKPVSEEAHNTDYFLDPLAPAKLPGRIFDPPSFGAAASTFRRRRRA